MLGVAKYDEFNHRRYSNPWVARVKSDGKIDFAVPIGGYSGAYGKGEAGELYITNPIEGAVYAYGQKDYRGNNGGYAYIKIMDGSIVHVDKSDLLEALDGL